MFDLRYHVASLAAVLVALAVGVLLGVAISGKVSDTEADSLRGLNDRLQQQLESERERTAAAGRSGDAAQRLVEAAYPALMADRLEGKRFALIFFGSSDDDGDIRDSVDKALDDAGSGSPLRAIRIELPLDPAALDEFLSGEAELIVYAGDGDFDDLGRDLGRELIEGGETPLLAALFSELVQERAGTTSSPVDGAVVVRSWTPPATDAADGAEQAEQARATESLVAGLLDGLDSTGLPVVGVETSSTRAEESDVDLYRERDVSSVDDIDTPLGRIALALVLAGGEEGHYGVKDSADAVAPPIEPVAQETGAE